MFTNKVVTGIYLQGEGNRYMKEDVEFYNLYNCNNKRVWDLGWVASQKVVMDNRGESKAEGLQGETEK